MTLGTLNWSRMVEVDKTGTACAPVFSIKLNIMPSTMNTVENFRISNGYVQKYVVSRTWDDTNKYYSISYGWVNTALQVTSCS